MSQESRRFERALFLSLGQIIGLGFAFLTPVYLSRSLSIEEFGSYRQILLLIWFASMTLHLGMDFGLFYYIRRHPQQAGMFSLNASIVGLLSGLLCIVCLNVGSGALAEFLNNPGLAPLLPFVGVVICVMVPSQHFEHLLVVMDKPKLVVLHASLNALAQAAITIGCIFWFRDLKSVLVGMGVFYAIKSTGLVLWNVYRTNWQQMSWGQWSGQFLNQLRHCMPLGVSGALAVLLQMDRMLVAAIFSVQQFTRYSVGCFELPVIPGLVNNIHDLMSIDMVRAAKERQHETVYRIWRESIEKVMVIMVPVTLVAAMFANDIITTIFSNKYADSAVYFQVYLLSVFLFAFDPEMIFRAYGKTKLSMHMQLAGTVLTVGLFAAGICWMGPLGALWGRAVANAVLLATRLTVTSRLMQHSLPSFIPWTVGMRSAIHAGLGIAVAIGCQQLLPQSFRSVGGVAIAAVLTLGPVFIRPVLGRLHSRQVLSTS